MLLSFLYVLVLLSWYTERASVANALSCRHYWLVESEADPQHDPLLVWYQGGPGAS
eukprot:COSAG06_NODE_45791_length_352_cov_0.616601_2_plen_55_part_01